MDPEEQIRRAFAVRRAREAMEGVNAHVTRIYGEHVDAIHTGVPILFPAAWAARYEGERGMAAGDLWAQYEVNPETLLSRCACGFAACPHFLKVLGKPLKAAERPRIRAALTEHMLAWFAVPGFHCAIKAAGDKASIPALCAALPSGQHLKADEHLGAKVARIAAHPPTVAFAESVFDSYREAAAEAEGAGGAYAQWAAVLDTAAEKLLDVRVTKRLKTCVMY